MFLPTPSMQFPWMHPERAPVGALRALRDLKARQLGDIVLKACPRTPEEKLAVLYHELGHFYVASAWGFRTDDMCLVANRRPNSLGYVSLAFPESAPDEGVIATYMGGPMAESMAGYLESGPDFGRSDRQQAENTLGREIGDHEWDHAWHGSRKILESSWAELETTANRIRCSGLEDLSHDELLDAVYGGGIWCEQ